MVRNETGRSAITAVLALVAAIGIADNASASEADAKNLLKAMSDYLAAQNTLSFDFDSNLEIVTKDHQNSFWRVPEPSVSADQTSSAPRDPADSPMWN